jgi:hypothetical protein
VRVLLDECVDWRLERNPDAGALDARLAAADFGVDGDAFE